jgi:hypothetical protein
MPEQPESERDPLVDEVDPGDRLAGEDEEPLDLEDIEPPENLDEIDPVDPDDLHGEP